MAKKIASYAPGDSYIVVHVDSEDTYSRKSFYLRTDESFESVLEEAAEEFAGKDADLEFNSGTFQIDDGTLRITPEVSPHLTYLVAEALFYQGFVDSDDSVETVVTEREPTRVLYSSLTGFVTDIEESDESLAGLLTDPEEPALIHLPGVDPYWDLMYDLDYAKLSEGFLTRTLVAMNYGHIYNKRSSFILDGSYGSDDAPWYVLPNDEGTLEHIQARYNENAAVGRLSSSKTFTFSEADKVPHHRHVFFDGTVRDLVEVLVEQGVELSDALDAEDFSDY